MSNIKCDRICEKVPFTHKIWPIYCTLKFNIFIVAYNWMKFSMHKATLVPFWHKRYLYHLKESNVTTLCLLVCQMCGKVRHNYSTFKAMKCVEMDGRTSLLLINDNFTREAIIVFMVTICVHHITANNNHCKIVTSPQLTSKPSL